MSKIAFSFNLGPISRTLGDPPDHIGFASLPVHEVTTALLGARIRDEFIAWLWHDTFKTLFTLVLRDKKVKGGSTVKVPAWSHLPGGLDTANLTSHFDRLAQTKLIEIDPNLTKKHHEGSMLSEEDTITNEFNQTYLGEKAHFVQLTFKCQPTSSTLVLRLAIAEAFLQTVGKVVAQAIAGLGLPFTQVKYVFQPEQRPLTEDQIAALYDMRVQDSTLWIVHRVPSTQFEQTWVQMDLTGAPPDRNTPQVIGLSELLTVYRDDLTIIVTLPLFITDPDSAVQEIERQMRAAAPDILEQIGIITTQKRAIVLNLPDVIFDEQVEVRLVCDVDNEPRDPAKPKKPLGKAIHKLIARPYELMADSSLTSHCLVCGSLIRGGKGRYFKSGKKVIESIFSDKFTDWEHVSFSDDICPMCLIYANSDNKKLLRGSLAILTPSTSLRAPVGHRRIEQPRFDRAGRFDPNMVKSAVTLQELVLLTLLSRRILSGLVTFGVNQETDKIGDIMLLKPVQGKKGETENAVVGKYLPYSGAYCLFDIMTVNQFYRTAFLGQEQEGKTVYDVWQEAHLTAYPFELTLSPSFTMLLELRQNADFKAHAQAHTLLKVNPTTVHLSPNLAFHVLVDNSVQEIVDKEYVAAARFLDELASMPGVNQYEFIEALLAGDDPITAAYETTEPPKKGRKPAIDWDTLKMTKARQMSDREEVMEQGSPDKMWATFVERSEKIRAMCQAHPTLIHFLHKPKRRGG